MLDPTLCNYLFIHCFASSFIFHSWKFKHQFIFPEKTQPINNPNCNTIKCNYTYERDPKVGRTWFVFFFMWVSARYNGTNNSHCFLTHAVHWSMLYHRGSKWGQCCPQTTFANVWRHFLLSQLGERGQYYDLMSRGQWQDSLPWIIQPQMSSGRQKSYFTLFKIICWEMNIFIHSLITSSIFMNIQSGLEIRMVLTAVHVLITHRHSQLDHISLFSISNQHLPKMRTTALISGCLSLYAP